MKNRGENKCVAFIILFSVHLVTIWLGLLHVIMHNIFVIGKYKKKNIYIYIYIYMCVQEYVTRTP